MTRPLTGQMKLILPDKYWIEDKKKEKKEDLDLTIDGNKAIKNKLCLFLIYDNCS